MKEYLEQNKERFLNELVEFLKIPSISADTAYTEHVEKGAQFLENQFNTLGLDKVQVYKTAGHPIVYAEKIIDPKLPTILFYGHYDVQPADPIELWSSPPFEPTIKKTDLHPDGAIFARGSCDDKGQIMMHIKALEAMLALETLSCNVKFMYEGEEEIGSENLAIFVQQNKDLLKSDVILISDTAMIANDQPSIETGLRGLTYMEVHLTGPNIDLHSGVYGGAVANPINVLSRMIAHLHDENGRITIPGFYDDVLELTAIERTELSNIPFDQKAYNKALDIKQESGESGYNTIERTSIRPTLDVNGIWGGYTGEGSKTVLPSEAHAKISMRLVPNQDWNKIAQLFEDHLKAIAPPTVTIKVVKHHGGQPYITPSDHMGLKAARLAMKESFGKAPFITRGGGSIPIVALFEKELGLKSILLGFGLDSDAIHSPNEHYGLFNFYKGIETIPLFFKYFALESKAQA